MGSLDNGVFALWGGGGEGAVGGAALVMALLGLGTAMRLRDAGLPGWAALGLLVPKINVFLVLWAMVLPRADSPVRSIQGALRALAGNRGKLTPWVGSVAALAGAAALFYFLVAVQGEYGAGLFVVVPFVIGFLPAMFVTATGHKTLAQCCSVSFTTFVFALGLLLLGGAEGVICILMAAPFMAVPVFIGAWVAYAVQGRPPVYDRSSPTLCSVLVFVPLAVLPVGVGGDRAPLRSVTTTVVVAAPPQAVWRNVVEFSELEPPDELMFRAGIAYPIRAEITGRGAGAVRHCVFSTGAFVEPITVWDEPRLLAFSVTQNPPTMDELTPYKIHPKHLDGYFRSERGQFELEDLGGGRTLLRGTTWYRQSFGPSGYWQIWSDRIIHTIHNRVLQHIRRSAESGAGD